MTWLLTHRNGEIICALIKSLCSWWCYYVSIDNWYRREVRANSLMRSHTLTEEGKEEEGPKARTWERDPALTMARVLLFNYLCCRPSVSLPVKDIMEHTYQRSNNPINGDEVPGWLAKAGLYAQTNTLTARGFWPSYDPTHHKIILT